MPLHFRKPKWPYSWVMERFDKRFLAEQVSIVLKDYEMNDNEYHGGPLQNLLGIVAEYTFDGFLTDKVKLNKRDYAWHKRTFNHQQDKLPWDFCVANTDELTFEIGAARPYHKHAVLKKAEYKTKSKYFVQIQIDYLHCIEKVYYHGKDRWFLFDAKNPTAVELTEQQAHSYENENNEFAQASLKGFDETAIIRSLGNDWQLGLKGNIPTKDADGWYKPIDELRDAQELREIIKAITGYD